MTRSTRAMATAVVLKNSLLGLSVFRAKRLAPGLPPVHEMIGRQNVQE